MKTLLVCEETDPMTEADVAKVRRMRIENGLAEAFGKTHPFWWPTIAPTAPCWWQRRARRSDARINAALATIGYKPLTQDMRDAYWREVRKGQSVHEDAGGYGMRQWYAALGLTTSEPVTYAAFVEEKLRETRP